MALLSPCINVCRMDDANQLCVGCFRTIDEIAIWSRCDDAARIEILARVEQRRAECPEGEGRREQLIRS